jgi:hypothetical protein
MWTQPVPANEGDPSTQAAMPTRADLYTFADDDPVNQTDPSGLGLWEGCGRASGSEEPYHRCQALKSADRHNRRNACYFNRAFYRHCQILFTTYATGHLTHPQLCDLWTLAESLVGPEVGVPSGLYCFVKYS